MRHSIRTGHWSISIHALREEGDSLRPGHEQGRGISIHALREEGDRRTVMMDMGIEISIHALREEGDWHPRH